MTKTELQKELDKMPDDAIVVCMDENGMWDNIESVTLETLGMIAIHFGGGSPFTDE